MKNNAIRMVVKYILHSLFFIFHFLTLLFLLVVSFLQGFPQHLLIESEDMTQNTDGKELVLTLQAYRGGVEKIVVVYLQLGIDGGGNCEIHNALANIGDIHSQLPSWHAYVLSCRARFESSELPRQE